MTNSTVDRLVDQYLSRLADAAQRLAPDRRSELLSEIREHIAASRAGATSDDEAAVRTMLDRLGQPSDIVAAALDDGRQDEPADQSAQRRPRLGLEVAAVVMLTLGSLIPVLGWAVGVMLLWSSGVWRRSEKLLGTLIVPGGPGLALLLGVIPTQTCTSGPTIGDGGPVNEELVCSGLAIPQWLGIPLLLLVLIAPIVVAAVLLSRARARAGLETTGPPAGKGR